MANGIKKMLVASMCFSPYRCPTRTTRRSTRPMTNRAAAVKLQQKRSNTPSTFLAGWTGPGRWDIQKEVDGWIGKAKLMTVWRP